MNFLLTGGAGYIGSHAALCLLDAGHNVHIIDNLSTGDEKLIPKEAEFTECNIDDEENISSILKIIQRMQLNFLKFVKKMVWIK